MSTESQLEKMPALSAGLEGKEMATAEMQTAEPPAFSLSTSDGFAGPDEEASPSPTTEPLVQRSVISWIISKGAKQVGKRMIKEFIETRIKQRVRKYIVERGARRQLLERAEDIIGMLEDPWWVTAIGFIPVVGDAFDLVNVPVKIRRALRAADRLEMDVLGRLANRSGRNLFGNFSFRGLVQNRNLGEVTDSQLTNAFRNTPFTLSSHANMRLRDPRTRALGMNTLNDFKQHMLNGTSELLDGYTDRIGISHGNLMTILDVNTNRIISIVPRR